MGSRLLSGALGLVGGVPGLVMLGGRGLVHDVSESGAGPENLHVSMPQQSTKFCQKTSAMSLPEASDNEEKTRQALEEQNRLISEQEVKIRGLKNQIADYQRWLDESSQSGSGAEIILKGLAEATNQLQLKQSRLTQMQGKAQSIQDVLAGLEERRVALIRQQAAEQNKV